MQMDWHMPFIHLLCEQMQIFCPGLSSSFSYHRAVFWRVFNLLQMKKIKSIKIILIHPIIVLVTILILTIALLQVLDTLLLGTTAVWSTCSSYMYLAWNWAAALYDKRTKLCAELWILSWASGLSCHQPTDYSSYRTTIQNITSLMSTIIISPAFAVHISCRYSTINGIVLSCNWLFGISHCYAILLTTWYNNN